MEKNGILVTGRKYHMAKGKNYKRIGKKLRMVREYKNQNFVLMIRMEKIKEELSEM